jgi:toxin YoeB
MKKNWEDSAWDDYLHWQKHDKNKEPIAKPPVLQFNEVAKLHPRVAESSATTRYFSIYVSQAGYGGTAGADVMMSFEIASKVKKINDLLKDIERHPFEGLGDPEPLKYDLRGWWSRRIDLEHRLVYRIAGGSQIEVLYCRWHYERDSQ